MLERLENPEPADAGIDMRYHCLVVFLCESGHHVTDWVAPTAVRPYLSHAAAYPYKKKAYAGSARLQVRWFLFCSSFFIFVLRKRVVPKKLSGNVAFVNAAGFQRLPC